MSKATFKNDGFDSTNLKQKQTTVIYCSYFRVFTGRLLAPCIQGKISF